MKRGIFVILLIIPLVLISGCAEKEVTEEFIGPGGSKTLEEYEDYCQKNPEECEKWCKENPKICAKYGEPHIQEKEVIEEEIIEPSGPSTSEEYKDYCQKNQEECEEWCEKNPEICLEYEIEIKKAGELLISSEDLIFDKELNNTLIDAHAHLFNIRKIDELVQAMDQNNVSKSVLFGGCGQNYLDRGTYRSGYDKNYNPPIAEAYDLYPERLYPCLSGFDPQDDRNVEYVESQLESGNFKCIGELYLVHCGLSGDNEEHWCPGSRKIWDEYKTIADHPVMQQIWNLSAQYNAPVFFHYERWERSDIEALYDMFEKYPATKFVWVHNGHTNNFNTLKDELKRFPNVYYETEEESGVPSETIRLFEKYSTRFLLGTDTGCTTQVITTKGNEYSEAISMHRQLLSELSQETADNVAYKNMIRLFSD